jgi:hypothetical protein
MVALAVFAWTVLMFVVTAVLTAVTDLSPEAEAVIYIPMAGLWLIGSIAVAVVVAERRRRPSGPQMVCTNCGTALFEQWRTRDGYACRACGQTTAGRMSDQPPPP